jgi:HEAT repeat protein
MLEDEIVVRCLHRGPGQEGMIAGPEEALPFMFYADGIRGLKLDPKMKPAEFDSVFDALVTAGRGRNSHDDLITLLWQANLGALEVESVPPEQTIFLSSRRPSGGSGGDQRGQSFAWGADGAEIRGEMGAVIGAQGLHRDTFDDWRLPDVVAHAPQAYKALVPHFETSRERFFKNWEEENQRPWTEQVLTLAHLALTMDPTNEMRQSLSHSVVTWVASALQKADWNEAEASLELLREVDPERLYSEGSLGDAIKEVDGTVIAEQLDEADPRDQARVAALIVHMGKPAIELAANVMSLCERARPRAAASTALCYVCGDQPELLRPLLHDSRWYVVRNAVMVLGEIGGAGVVELLRIASTHHEPRVLREVVRSLGSVSRAERTPVLIQQLSSRDPQLVSSALSMLIREPHPRITRAILDRIAARDFDNLTPDLQRAFINTLSEVADDATVPALEHLLMRDGGWFAMRTITRDAAARILQRVGTDRAIAVLERGLRSKTEAIRSACLSAMGRTKRAA